MTYELIDQKLSDWAGRHGLQLCTQFQDTEVRTVFLQGRGTERGQIWIDPPTSDGRTTVHIAVYRKRHKDNEKMDMPADGKDLDDILEGAYVRVAGWLEEEA